MNDLSRIAKHIEVRLLRYVIAVAEELHFGRASDNLHLAAPSLSKQIRQLEMTLGYDLFTRHTRQVVLTPAGAAFVMHAREALSQIAQAVECGAAAAGILKNELVIAHTPWLLPSVLLSLSQQVSERLPDIHVTLRSMSASAYPSPSLEPAFDAGIFELPIKVSSLETKWLWGEDYVLAVPDGHPLATGSGIDPSQLAPHPVVSSSCDSGSALSHTIKEYFARERLSPQIVCEVSNSIELYDLVRSGVGVGFVRRSTSQRFPAVGVTFVEFAEPRPRVDTAIAYCVAMRRDLLELLSDVYARYPAITRH